MKNTIDFIGIGAARSGSTWVSHCLSSHPQILFSGQESRKELRFFNTSGNHSYDKDNISNYHRGIDWYISQFPPEESGKIRGEFSVSYLTDSEAPLNIKKHFPDAKILVILRNPVDMLYSLYHFSRATVDLNVPSSFKEYIFDDRIIDIGKYSLHLKNYFTVFSPNNIHVMLFDDIKNNPSVMIKDLYNFLGVDPSFVPPKYSSVVNSALKTRSKVLKNISQRMLHFASSIGLEDFSESFLSREILYRIYMLLNIRQGKYPPLDDEVREFLKNKYIDDITSLEKLIGRNLPSWKLEKGSESDIR